MVSDHNEFLSQKRINAKARKKNVNDDSGASNKKHERVWPIDELLNEPSTGVWCMSGFLAFIAMYSQLHIYSSTYTEWFLTFSRFAPLLKV